MQSFRVLSRSLRILVLVVSTQATLFATNSSFSQEKQSTLSSGPRSMKTVFTCKVMPPAEKAKNLNLWIPLPSDSDLQKIENVTLEGVEKWKITQEPKFGNRMVFIHFDSSQTTQPVVLKYTVTRKEMRVLSDPPPAKVIKLSNSESRKFLDAEKSLPVGGRFMTISNDVTRGKHSTLDKAHAIYEHVVGNMKYDYKNESPKLGEGDAEFVCDAKLGDCTDIHSYLISLARSQGIPSLHEYGFGVSGIPVASPLPEEAKITSYHCYPCLYQETYGWVPTDASDGIRWLDKGRADLKNYQFGNLALERNAVAISHGRNLILSPAQQGEPVNKFIYPYAEEDGKPIKVGMEMSRHILEMPTVSLAELMPAPIVEAPTPMPLPATSPVAPVQNQAPPIAPEIQQQLDELRLLIKAQAKEIAELRDQNKKPIAAAPAKEVPPVVLVVPSREKLSIYGFLRVDGMLDNSLTNNTQSPLYVLSPDNANKLNKSNGALAIHPRLSRLGINFNAPPETSSGWRVGGKLEMDWQNGAGLTVESRPLPRIRHAYFTLQKAESTLLFGQFWDLISPLNPTVNDDTLMWNAGNIGDRRVQIRYTFEPKKSPFNLAMALGLTGAIDAKDLDSNSVRDGENSTLPHVQMRASWKGAKSGVGIWGHYASETTTKQVAGRTHFTGYSLGIDGQHQLTSRLSAMGEYWTGSNLSDFRGGIGQGVIAATGVEVRSHGGWAELGYQASPKYKMAFGYTAETPEANDLPTGGRQSNSALYFHNRYKLTNNVDLGASYLFWSTRYKGQAAGTDHRIQMFIQHNF